MTIEGIMELWNTYYPVVYGFGVVVVGIGGSILIWYMKVKPAWDLMKEKVTGIFDKTTNADAEDIKNILLNSDLEVKIAELEDKIANPLTSESSRTVYQTQVKVLIQTKTKLDAGLIKVEEISSKY